MTKIENLTYRELKEIAAMFGDNYNNNQPNIPTITDDIGKKVIVRTYSAGVWFGQLDRKIKQEVYLKNARRLWGWYATKGISLSGVGKYGVSSKSRICVAVPTVWLEAVEIIPASQEAIESIEAAPESEPN